MSVPVFTNLNSVDANEPVFLLSPSSGFIKGHYEFQSNSLSSVQSFDGNSCLMVRDDEFNANYIQSVGRRHSLEDYLGKILHYNEGISNHKSIYGPENDFVTDLDGSTVYVIPNNTDDPNGG